MNDIDQDIRSWQDAADADQAQARNPELSRTARQVYAGYAEYAQIRVRHLKDEKARQEAAEKLAKARRQVEYLESMARIPAPTHTMTDNAIYRWEADEARKEVARLVALSEEVTR